MGATAYYGGRMGDDGGRRRRIVVAEDDPDVRVLLELLLGSVGYDVQMVRDGRAVLEALAIPEPVDLLILDIAMPGELDGLDVTRAVRSDAQHEALPILLLSARTQAAHIEEGLAAGASDYVVKPFDTEVLLDRIALLLEAG